MNTNKNYDKTALKMLTDYNELNTKSLTKLNEMVLNDNRLNKLVYLYLSTNESAFNLFNKWKLTLTNFNFPELKYLKDQKTYFENKEYKEQFKDNLEYRKAFSLLDTESKTKAQKRNEVKEKYRKLLLDLMDKTNQSVSQLAKAFNLSYSNLYNFFKNDNLSTVSLEKLVEMYKGLSNL